MERILVVEDETSLRRGFWRPRRGRLRGVRRERRTAGGGASGPRKLGVMYFRYKTAGHERL